MSTETKTEQFTQEMDERTKRVQVGDGFAYWSPGPRRWVPCQVATVDYEPKYRDDDPRRFVQMVRIDGGSPFIAPEADLFDSALWRRHP
jgi:hypothetical protein